MRSPTHLLIQFCANFSTEEDEFEDDEFPKCYEFTWAADSYNDTTVETCDSIDFGDVNIPCYGPIYGSKNGWAQPPTYDQIHAENFTTNAANLCTKTQSKSSCIKVR